METIQIVGQNIRNLRLNNHYTRKQLGEALNLSPNQIMTIESAQSSMGLKRIKDFAQAFGIEVSSLMDEGAYPLTVPEAQSAPRSKALTSAERKLVSAFRRGDYDVLLKMTARRMRETS